MGQIDLFEKVFVFDKTICNKKQLHKNMNKQ